MVSLWDMLTLFAGSAAFGGALAAAVTAGVGGSTMAVVAILGVAMGIGCTLLVRRIGVHVGRTIERESAVPGHERRFRMLYAGAVLWIGASAYLANRIAAAALFVIR